MAGPLSHVRVLDLSRVMAGPWAGQLLADLGADVVKVERPGAGDETRGWGPPFLKDRDGAETRESGYFLCTNRAKRSLTLDLTRPEGQKIVRELAARSDIVLENFKVSALARYGLAYEDLKKVNPRIIYCSLTGFGQSGPRASSAAYDFMIQAMGGLMSVTGEEDGRPGGGPQKVGVPIVDLMTGMYATISVLAALSHREQTGEGDYIDLAMLDVQAAILANQAMNYLLSGRAPRRYGNGHPNIMPQQVFECRDGRMVLAVGNDGQYAKLCEVLGHPDLRDERYTRNKGRVEHRDELLGLIARLLSERGRGEVLDALEKAGVPAGPINTIPEMFEDPQAKHRGILVDIAHPLSGTVRQVANPMRFTGSTIVHDRHPPLLGEHTETLLRDLGYSDEKIAALKRDGVV